MVLHILIALVFLVLSSFLNSYVIKHFLADILFLALHLILV